MNTNVQNCTFVYFNNYFYTGNGKTKDSEVNGSISPN